MPNLYLGQDVANKRERKQTAAHIVAKSYPLGQAVRMSRYGSLIIKSSDFSHAYNLTNFSDNKKNSGTNDVVV